MRRDTSTLSLALSKEPKHGDEPGAVLAVSMATWLLEGARTVIELELQGRSEDGGSLILISESGEKFRLRATPELRSETSRALLVSEKPALPAGRVSPGELQALLRQGLTPAQVAQETGAELERVLRYFSPVAAEIDRAVTSAQASRVGPEFDSPTMGDLVIDRLAARGVDLETVEWTASRQPDQDWTVHLSYQQGDQILHASWVAPPGSGHIEAQDPVATQLTETIEAPAPITGLFPPAPLLPRTRPRGPKVETEEVDVDLEGFPPPPGPDDVKRREDLVEVLNRARGKYTPVMDDMGDLDEEDEGLSGGPEPVEESAEQSEEEGQGQLDFVAEVQPPPTTSRKRPGRTPMPSWDEIVFGSKQD